MSVVSKRRVTLITGANGGMGRACARVLGATTDLVLTDIAAGPLEAFASDLVAEGYSVAAAIPGDLSEGDLASSLASAVTAGGGLASLVHAAGRSPVQADWRTIVAVNLVATEKLLRCIEPILTPGSTTILIASMAGHMIPANADADLMLADPLDPHLLVKLEPIVSAMASGGGTLDWSMAGYALSKRAMIRMCERRAAAWGVCGARIVSISPGTIQTPMGQRGARENPGMSAVMAATPAGRWGTVMDITAAIRFLTGDEASFVTGCDLRIDGGATAALRGARAGTSDRSVASGP